MPLHISARVDPNHAQSVLKLVFVCHVFGVNVRSHGIGRGMHKLDRIFGGSSPPNRSCKDATQIR